MVGPTDALTEACQVAGVVAGEEASIAEIESLIADRIREICFKIFAGAKFRMPKQTVGICLSADDVSAWGIAVWADIGAVLDNRIQWTGEFHGDAQTLRITTDGKILAVWQHVPTTRQYNLFSGEDYAIPTMVGDMGEKVRLATDHEIAANAVEIAEDLLVALRKRIDAAKEEKVELQRLAGLEGVSDE